MKRTLPRTHCCWLGRLGPIDSRTLERKARSGRNADSFGWGSPGIYACWYCPLDAVREFVVRCHGERNHQGIGNLLIFLDHSLADRGGPIRYLKPCRRVLNYYDRAACS